VSDHQHDPFARVGTALPRTLSRAGRVELLAEIADDLLAGRVPDRTAAVWLGSALTAWLLASKRANLVRDYLEVQAPLRSKTTPQTLYRRICAQKAQTGEGSDDGASHPEIDDR
jgi:hypothetical protein